MEQTSFLIVTIFIEKFRVRIQEDNQWKSVIYGNRVIHIKHDYEYTSVQVKSILMQSGDCKIFG